MTYRCWKIGMHIQPDTIRAVAVTQGRNGWQLRQWWQIPCVQTETALQTNILAQTLTHWRRSLPVRHEVYMAFCAARTVQRQLPRPMALHESQCEHYIASATAQQMQMPVGDLCWDYQTAINEDKFYVTAAHRHEVAMLRNCAQTLGLNLKAVTPDASALSSFYPWLEEKIKAIIFYNGIHWLWSTYSQWGSLPPHSGDDVKEICHKLTLDSDEIVCCGHISASLPPSLTDFDPWQILNAPRLPRPAATGHFAVALGLAIGQYPQ